MTFSSSDSVQGPFVDKKRIRQSRKNMAGQAQIKTLGINQLVKNLSGGSQQKVVLSRMLATRWARHFDEADARHRRGCEAGVYNLMLGAPDGRKRGKRCLMVASARLIGMSDRMLVMRFSCRELKRRGVLTGTDTGIRFRVNRS